MSIERFYTKEFTIRRMVWSNESSSEVEQTIFYGHLQQASPEIVESLGLVFTKTFKVWCKVDVDIVEQDKISDGTFTYIVRSVESKDYNIGAMNPHLEAIVERTKIK